MDVDKTRELALTESFLSHLRDARVEGVVSVDASNHSFVVCRPVRNGGTGSPKEIEVRVSPEVLGSDFDRVLRMVRDNDYYDGFRDEDAVWDFLDQMLSEALIGTPSQVAVLQYRYNDFVPI